jgi:hypothetical protein
LGCYLLAALASGHASEENVLNPSGKCLTHYQSALVNFQFKSLISACQAIGIYAKNFSAQTKKKVDNAAACLCFLNYLAFLRPAADRALSVLPWVVSRGRSYGFFLGWFSYSTMRES